MPNIKSAKKRVEVIKKKTMRNNSIKSGYKTAIKKAEAAIEAKNIEEAKKLTSFATKKIDQACAKGVIVKILQLEKSQLLKIKCSKRLITYNL